jgi:uncharacterized protein YdaU (DUF1376 family)
MRVVPLSPGDWRTGCDSVAMTIEQEGFYFRLLSLLYVRDGLLYDRDGENADMMRLDVRTYRRLKGQLLTLGKLFLRDGLIVNKRASEEVAAYNERRKAASDGGVKGAAARKLKATSGPTSGPTSAELRANFEGEVGPKLDGFSHTEANENNDLGETNPKPKPKPKPEPSVAVAAAAQIDSHALYEKLTEAANGALHPLATGLATVGEPLSWLKEGADLDVDVLPVVRVVSRRAHQQGRQISAWSYFAGAVAEAKARRERGLPQVNLPPPDDGSNASQILAEMRAKRIANGGEL